jgi:hypothetical protein
VAVAAGGAQAAEREAFRAVGWDWLRWRRRVVELGEGRFRVEAVDPEGGRRGWEVAVAPGRVLPVPDCGRPVEQAPKSETEVVVTDVVALTP